MKSLLSKEANLPPTKLSTLKKESKGINCRRNHFLNTHAVSFPSKDSGLVLSQAFPAGHQLVHILGRALQSMRNWLESDAWHFYPLRTALMCRWVPLSSRRPGSFDCWWMPHNIGYVLLCGVISRWMEWRDCHCDRHGNAVLNGTQGIPPNTSWMWGLQRVGPWYIYIQKK